MLEPMLCPGCGVPDYITSEHVWLDNGDIVHSRGRSNRIVFIESENIDPLLAEIEKLLGVSIEHIVIAGVQKYVREPFSLFVPDDFRERVLKGEIDYRSFLDTFILISNSMGRGKLELVDLRYQRDEKDSCTFRITEPFSLPLCCGARAAGIEAILGYAHGVSYERISPETYLIKVFPSQRTKGLAGRLLPVVYQPVQGGIELEKCATCGSPRALADYGWDQDRGVIQNKTTKRRMVLLGPQELDPVFRELEEELGETIPQVVVEAQRRSTRSGIYAMGDLGDEGNLRGQLALRGLGNLRSLRVGKQGLGMRLDNAILHLIVVGMMQGLFDMAYDVDSTVEWELSKDGKLEMEVASTT